MHSSSMIRHTCWMGLLWLGVTSVAGCASSGSQVESEPMPFSMYDSPLVASDAPVARASGPLPEGQTATASTATTPETPSSSGTAPSEDSKTPRAESTYADAPDFGSVEPGANPGAGDAHPDAARYVHAVYRANQLELPAEAKTDIKALYQTCRERDGMSMSGRPAAGDIVFFHNTVDANGDGRNNDWYSYVAIVERPGDGDRIELLGYRDGEVQSFRINRERPGSATANTRLRTPSGDDPPFTRYRAGQLFAGYCSLLGDRREVVVIDHWEPGMEIEPPSK